jgi:hypothetical protein
MNKLSRTFGCALFLSAFSALAWADGRITQIDFSGPDDQSHPDVVQITIEGASTSRAVIRPTRRSGTTAGDST